MLDITQNKIYISTALSIFFLRIANIRHAVFDFEEALKERYSTPPAMTPIADAIEPTIPRFSFSSLQGHSQINVSQTNLTLNVKYDKEYLKDYEKCEEYSIQRLKLIYPILERITGGKLCYSGVVSKVQYLADSKNEQAYFKILADRFLSEDNYNENLHDLSFKYTISKDNTNFINLVISNFRNFSISSSMMNMPMRLSRTMAQSVGVQVSLDVNDRMVFNENEGYSTNLNSILGLFAISKEIIAKKLDAILETGKVLL